MSPAELAPAAMLALLQASVGDQVDLNTLLLAILLGLGTWTLVSVHQLHVKHGRVEERVWGTDGSGGHDALIRELRVDVDALKGALVDVRAVLRMQHRRSERISAHLEDADA